MDECPSCKRKLTESLKTQSDYIEAICRLIGLEEKRYTEKDWFVEVYKSLVKLQRK